MERSGRTSTVSDMTHRATLRGSVGSWAALSVVLATFWPRPALAATCREGPGASPNTCSLPAGLGNFQGEPDHLSTNAPYSAYNPNLGLSFDAGWCSHHHVYISCVSYVQAPLGATCCGSDAIYLAMMLPNT